jgi:hypothetical protein
MDALKDLEPALKTPITQVQHAQQAQQVPHNVPSPHRVPSVVDLLT